MADKGAWSSDILYKQFYFHEHLKLIFFLYSSIEVDTVHALIKKNL